MINTSKPFNLDDYKEFALRRLKYILAPFFIISIIGCAYAYFAPGYYEAKTLIIATPQRIPKEFVRTTVPSLITEQLHSIEQEIKSQTRLEQIIKDFDLHAKHKNGNPTSLVEALRKSISVQVTQRRDRADSGGYISIGFIDRDPVFAANITNRLAELFIEESVKIREHQASGASDFMKDELDANRKKLEHQERIVSAYKMRHMGELPEQKDTNIRMLESLQQIYQRTGENLRSAQDRQLVIQRQISDLEYPARRAADPSSPGSREGTTGDPQLLELKTQYSELKSRYKESHPDIRRMKRKIEELESNMELDIRTSPRYRELNSQLSAVNLEIKRLRDEETRVRAEMDQYKGRIERTTEREQQLASLTREYQNTKTFYDTLLQKSQEASQAENLEKRQKGEQFRVIDPATPPTKPVKPKRELIVLLGFILGGTAGLGMAFVREQMDHSFHDPEDVEITLGLRTIAGIPKLHEPARAFDCKS